MKKVLPFYFSQNPVSTSLPISRCHNLHPVQNWIDLSIRVDLSIFLNHIPFIPLYNVFLWSESCSVQFSHVQFFVTPQTVVHGILQARILEWVAFPFSRGTSQPRNWTQVSRIAGKFFISWARIHSTSLRVQAVKQKSSLEISDRI